MKYAIICESQWEGTDIQEEIEGDFSSEQEALDGAWATICESADYIEIERSSDGSGWIVSIDDLPGDQQTTVESAIASAFHRWRK